MKNSLITMTLALLFLFGFSQNQQEPPRSVRKSFEKDYPKSNPSQWTHTASGWSVDFEDKDHDNGEVTAHFDASGKHLDTAIPYNDKDIPAGIKDNLKKKYPKSDKYQYTRIDRSGQASVYKVRLRQEKTYKTLYVDQDGHQKE